MIDINNLGIEDYKREPSKPNEVCRLKINGEWICYKMTTDEYGWLYVVFPIDEKIYEISLLDIGKIVNRKRREK